MLRCRLICKPRQITAIAHHGSSLVECGGVNQNAFQFSLEMNSYANWTLALAERLMSQQQLVISELKQHVSIIHCDRGDSWLYPLEKELESPSPSVLIGISKFLTEHLPKTS